ncbi:isoprenoid biosynthesis glyoxalase ElbB [Neiella marina]|uniref:Glyoxalase n=1 Tax=Neiella holothuriorum TaxID=2870530 RepID=A0ABS7EJ54_9GAMM|nr:isoprenoid biosynthesis glyoxalase ElbB [Neiella holothuriorum]MBW8192387.1 isoprenoid biosynthesis glyoxalase ElbB [Neiella holothuriorum]
MAKVAVILAGCGVFDGAEIHEAVCTLLALSKRGVDYQCFAPDIEQAHVINHLTGEVAEERRNVLVEAARIARGEVKALASLDAGDFDAVIVPGGFGAAKNLSDFAFNGTDMVLEKELERSLKSFAAVSKPVGLLCIAPVIAPLIYGAGVKVTIGCDAEVATAISAMGGEHVDALVEQPVVDEVNKLVTVPAYMLGPDIASVATGIDALVGKVLALAAH